MLSNVLLAAVLPLAGVAALGDGEVVSYFPGPYYDSVGRATLERVVMESWPSPSSLLTLWRGDDLSEEERVTILLGGAAFHDPRLLALYEEAIRSDSPRLRMAAAYGYRDLVADATPAVAGGVSVDEARVLASEMRAVARTLRYRPLIEVWVEALLKSEGGGLPGYRGVILDRPPTVAVRAIERLMAPPDLDLLVTGYQLSSDREHRLYLLKLIEGITLSSFVVKPQGARVAWSPDAIYDRALQRLDSAIVHWRRRDCRADFETVVASNLARMGAEGARPLEPGACGVWLKVLEKGRPEWSGLAARRLYACGGPWVEISILEADSPTAQQNRRYLVSWYRHER